MRCADRLLCERTFKLDVRAIARYVVAWDGYRAIFHLLHFFLRSTSLLDKEHSGCYTPEHMKSLLIGLTGLAFAVTVAAAAEQNRPNILFIITDDHAVQALGTSDNDSPVPLPGFRRLAQEGMVFDRAYCANSLCGPARASMLTGRHSHNNGFMFNMRYDKPMEPFDGSQPTYPKMLQAAGYQTGLVGKWHLFSRPTGFDFWQVFPNQGDYWDPEFLTDTPSGKGFLSYRARGYVTDLLTTKAIDWLERRDKSRPFALVLGHKAPHRNWIPAPRHLQKIREYVAKLTPPPTLQDDWKDRPAFLSLNRQTVSRDLCNWNDSHLQEDLIPFDVMKELVPKQALKRMLSEGKFAGQVPPDFDMNAHSPKFAPITNYGNGLANVEKGVLPVYRDFYAQRTRAFVEDVRAGKIRDLRDMTERRWRWYMEDYLGTLLAVDESISTILNYLDSHGLSENTLVIYVGDQGFYLGEHGLYDKRWIFEETMRMPLIMRWKGKIPGGVRSRATVQNIDYAPTIAEVAGVNTPENKKSFDGESLVPLFATGADKKFEGRALYYAFYENPGEHNAPLHDGVRTDRYTFAHILSLTPEEKKTGVRKMEDEWLLIDNEKDPQQMHNVAADPAYKDIFLQLKAEYEKQRAKFNATL